MKLQPCVFCTLPVLEIEGQFEVLDLLYVSGPNPPRETVGWWHVRCLAESDAAVSWYEGRLGSLLVRRYHVVAEYAHWTVLHQPMGDETIALGRGGELLNLSRGRQKLTRAVDGGRIYPVVEAEYHLELDDSDLVRDVQQMLLTIGSYPLPAVLQAMRIADKVVHPEALESGLFKYNQELQRYWGKNTVSLSAEYGVFLPAELERHIGPSVR